LTDEEAGEGVKVIAGVCALTVCVDVPELDEKFVSPEYAAVIV
jgi:hypothetical protein